ncbi:PAS domain-containing protein [uncultured Limimaricola sp.]|uniref:PAS domain-containing protein n=1 Tax=uncultured Limimaricola sp. TaxID=2211667 RepID=UPI0030FACB06
MTMHNEIARDTAAARLSEVEAYWRSLIRRGLPPLRAHIDPNRIGTALSEVFLLDAIAPGAGRLRIAGRALCDLAGDEARGLPLSCLFAHPARARLSDLLERAFEAHHPCRAPLTVPGMGGGRGPVGALLLLPLRPHAGMAPQILGALAHDLSPGLHRFGFAGPVRIGAPPTDATPLRLVPA